MDVDIVSHIVCNIVNKPIPNLDEVLQSLNVWSAILYANLVNKPIPNLDEVSQSLNVWSAILYANLVK